MRSENDLMKRVAIWFSSRMLLFTKRVHVDSEVGIILNYSETYNQLKAYL